MTRFIQPEPVVGKTVMIVAAIGILINGVTAWLFASGRKGDLNIRGAFLHMAADAAISAGVVAAGFVILLTGWLWLDPAVSLVIVGVIIWGTWDLLRDSVTMSLDAVPAAINPADVEKMLLGRSGVSGVHDLHIWPMSTTEIALTAHLVMCDGCPNDKFLFETAHELREHYGIAHVTLQIETEGSGCPLAPAHTRLGGIMQRSLAIVDAALMSRFIGVRYAAACRSKIRWNPHHLSDLPPEIQNAVARMCRQSPKAEHYFAVAHFENSRRIVLHFEHLNCDSSEHSLQPVRLFALSLRVNSRGLSAIEKLLRPKHDSRGSKFSRAAKLDITEICSFVLDLFYSLMFTIPVPPDRGRSHETHANGEGCGA